MKKDREIKLKTEKNNLEKQLKSFAQEDKKPDGDDWTTKYPKYDGDIESEADEVQEYEKLLSVEYSLEKRLVDINAALEKIKKGGYGKCEKCGKKIDPKRLDACPEARVCINCR